MADDRKPVGAVCLCSKEELKQRLQVYGALAIGLSQTKLLSLTLGSLFCSSGVGDSLTSSILSLLMWRQN